MTAEAPNVSGAAAPPGPPAERPLGLFLAAAYLLFTSLAAAAALGSDGLPLPTLLVLALNVAAGGLLLLRRKAAVVALVLSLAVNVVMLARGGALPPPSVLAGWLIYLAVTGYAVGLVRRGVLR